MLERIPAAAESTAHLFLRNFEQPVRSSRVLDPRFWRNGADNVGSSQSSTWWASYLQHIRTIPQTRSSPHEDAVTLLCSPSWSSRSSYNRHGRDISPRSPVKLRKQQRSSKSRSYSVSTPLIQGAALEEADSTIDGVKYSNNDKLIDSRGIPKEQTDPNKEGHKVLKKKQQPVNGQAQYKPDPITGIPVTKDKTELLDPDAFDLIKDAGVDRLDNKSYSRPDLWPKNGVEARTPQTDKNPKMESKFYAKRMHQDKQPVYKSDDLGITSEVQRHDEAFESENLFNAQRSTHQALRQSTHGVDRVPSQADEPRSAVSSPEKEADLMSGWHFSNPFSLLVPDGRPQESSFAEQPASRKASGTLSSKQPGSSHDESVEGIAVPKETKAQYVPLHDELVQNHDRYRQPSAPQATSEVVEVSKSDKGRLDQLLSVKNAATLEQFDEAWSLFLSMEDQETMAPYVFRFLTRSHNSKHFPRALAAFKIIPRPRRTKLMYQAAMHIELKRYQHGNAMNLAFEANVRGFNILPELLAHLVEKCLWNSAAELLHRNRDARRDFAQFAIVPEDSGLAQMQMLPPRDLVRGCAGISDLHAKVLSLAERVRAEDIAFMEHKSWLLWLCRQLATQAVQSSAVMTNITPQALVTIFDLEDSFGPLGLHVKALETIFSLPERDSKLNLALVIYRNFRFKYPDSTSSQRYVHGLILLCAEADHFSPPLYDYLLGQFTHKPSMQSYQIFMTCCARHGEPEAVMKYLRLLIRDHGMPARTAFVNPLIHAYAVTGDVSNAKAQFDHLETQYGCKPNAVSYNMLMLAYVRSEDDASAFQVLEQMRERRIKLNEYTYGQLLAVCASHGDTELALDLLVDARDEQVEISVPMLNTMVELYLKKDNVPTALRFATAAVGNGTGKQLTRLWNSFVRYFAFKGQFADLMKTRDLMARYKVAADGMTYAAIVALLVSRKQTHEAMQLLREMHRKEKLPITRFHYTLILHGFVAERNRDMATVILHELEQQYPGSNSVVNFEMLSLKNPRKGGFDGTSGIRMLVQLLKNTRSIEGTSLHPTTRKPEKNTGSVLTCFEIVIRALLRSGSREAAAQLAKHAEDLSRKGQDSNSKMFKVPKKLSLTQLDLAMEREDWVEFDKIWKLTFEHALEANRSIVSVRSSRGAKPNTQSDKSTVSSTAKHRLGSYLSRYMEAMARQNRQQEMQDFVQDKLWASGFEFTGRNWNKYIQVLCRSRNPKDQVQAFKLFEKLMRRNTQSWKLLTRGKLTKKTTTYLWKPYGSRRRPILQKQERYRVVTREDELRLHPQRRIPTYLTVVHLGAVLMQAHFRIQRGLSRQFELIKILAPRTKRFIQYMPRMKDEVQGRVLRQQDYRDGKKRRPRSEQNLRERVALDGLIGDQSPLDHLPLDFLNNIKEIAGRSDSVRTLPGNKAGSGSEGYKRLREVELGEMLTGQISREPMLLSGKGRLETISEMERRIVKEERKKREVVQRLETDLRARSSSRDVPKSRLRAEPPPDYGVDHQEAPIQQPDPAVTSLLSTLNELSLQESSQERLPQQETSVTRTSGSRRTESRSKVAVSQELDTLARIQEPRNRGDRVFQSRARRMPELAIPYANRRRLRRRLALSQRKQARRLLAEYKDDLTPKAFETRSAAGKRLEAFERAQGRRAILLAYERDLRAGRRLDPFPKTARGLRSRQAFTGSARVRFVADIGRKSKNYMVRRGVLHDRRQRRVQTTASKDFALYEPTKA